MKANSLAGRERAMAYSYKVDGKKITLEADPSVVAVQFRDDLTKSGRASASDAVAPGAFARRFEVPGEEFTIIPVTDSLAHFPGTVANSAAASLNAREDVVKAHPVFRLNGNQVITSDRILVGLVEVAQKDMIATKYGIIPIRDWDDTVVYKIPNGVDVFRTVEALEKDRSVNFVEPDFITLGHHIPSRVNNPVAPMLSDPLVASQYAMTITKALQAWAIQDGKREIVIAILDEGVDSSHKDLAAAIVGTYDGVDDDSFQEPNPWDGHGTSCAGLAAAVPNNSFGIRGSGGGCGIFGVRIARSAADGSPWQTSNEIIARAINWAWKNGASVLSNSWGGGAPSSVISNEFDKARKLGRNGLGCVVVVAAGNDFNVVSFPGNLSDVLTVAASNQYDEAKTLTSRDGETWWGTNHGIEVDVAAPGVQNLTTDISSTNGYDPSDFYPRFNGTSSATPIVAGACGLVLSANPKLTEIQVRKIIKDSAEKVGPYPYVGGRNDFFGAGRLNVLKAVQKAISLKTASKKLKAKPAKAA
jgi:thermitase